MDDQQAEYKKHAAEFAANLVQDGMVVGLGFGSTAIHAIRRLAKRILEGDLKDVRGIPASESTAQAARDLSIPLVDLDTHPVLDLTIDGADEIDPNWNMIKGGGGALLREKILAQASKRLIIVVDESKLSPHLGHHFPVPVEIIPFSLGASIQFLESLGAKASLREAETGQRFVTDEGNWILDCNFGSIENPMELAKMLEQRAGIAEHGLFLGLATEVVVAGPDGVRRLTKSE
jgi:ribose 5-phosphate isomerase A